MIRAVIAGVGKYNPDKVLTNQDLEKMVETSDEWITERTGIRERRICEADTYTSCIASKAAERAIENAEISPEEIELIIVGTVTPEFLTPSVSCLVQKNIGAVNAACFDLNAACSGFVYSMDVADTYIRSGKYKTILIIGADCLSKITDYEDRNTCILFGDGAGAAILRAEESERGVTASHIFADGSMGHLLTLPFLYRGEDELQKRVHENKQVLWMDGSEVFKFAVRVMRQEVEKVAEKGGISVSDIDVLIPHQANTRIIDGAVKRLKIDKSKVFVNIQKYGNTSSGSIAVALAEAIETGTAKPGDNVVLVGFGGGMTCGAVYLKL